MARCSPTVSLRGLTLVTPEGGLPPARSKKLLAVAKTLGCTNPAILPMSHNGGIHA